MASKILIKAHDFFSNHEWTIIKDVLMTRKYRICKTCRKIEVSFGMTWVEEKNKSARRMVNKIMKWYPDGVGNE
jgi:hypothetical protein